MRENNRKKAISGEEQLGVLVMSTNSSQAVGTQTLILSPLMESIITDEMTVSCLANVSVFG